MTAIDKVLYTAKAHTTGGRDGASRTSDGRLDVKLSTPGTAGGGTNPEQLFAAGWSACFLSAMKYVARNQKIAVPDAATVSASVGVGPRDDGKGFGLEVALEISLPSLDRDTAKALVEQAHIVCPYSHATRGNISVALHVA